MTKAIARLIKEELDWMREAQRDWGHILIDPHLINVARNPALQRLFSESELVKSDPFHWKLLLACLAPIVYSPPKAGPGRPVGWTPEVCHELLSEAYRLRLATPKKSVDQIAYELEEPWKKRKLIVDRERIQNLLRDARAKVGGGTRRDRRPFSISTESEGEVAAGYRLGVFEGGQIGVDPTAKARNRRYLECEIITAFDLRDRLKSVLHHIGIA
ncbi:hypothetical protein [Bradyrhizobium sp. BRP56]|uniref:hypothetical protein n=1 Tax=Bradyrhizobium sp. BRP56 TaxID=2793819 RepID=UPI001CD50F68|nr:hypothetical protein [Bradyrhizobium sp. BRP56]MCA1399095.1 hypothetical protein [Bradyrhizobium sp. BRP56]